MVASRADFPCSSSRSPMRTGPVFPGGVQGVWGTRSPGAPIDNACARLRTHTLSAALSGDTTLAVPERVEPMPSAPAPGAAGTDPSGRRAPAAGCICTGSGHVSPGLAGRWQPVQSSCSDWTSRSPSPLAIKIAPGTESVFGETRARQASLRGCCLSVLSAPKLSPLSRRREAAQPGRAAGAGLSRSVHEPYSKPTGRDALRFHSLVPKLDNLHG